MTQPQPTDGFEWTQAPWGPVLRCRPLAEIADHFFTERSLELREDRDEWNSVARLAGVPPGSLLLLNQVHGNTIVTARSGDAERWARPRADGVVSDDGAAALVVRVADCAPILMADRRRRAAAAVHAGWRSTMARITPAALEVMQSEFSTEPADVVAAIGPSLGPCCGEMGEEIVQAFRDCGHSDEDLARWFERAPGQRPHFDLWRANRDQLLSAGVPASQIHVAALCTKTHTGTFHSYRAEGASAGRMAAVIRARR
jgi:YfiH family protein